MGFTEKIEGKKVLISGGSRGIGLATAKLLAQKGASVTIIARDFDRLQQAIHEIGEVRATEEQVISGMPVDVTKEEIVDREIQNWIRVHGTPDILINSAGFAHPGEIEELATDIYRKSIDINYFGTVYLVKSVIPSMIREGKGTIVNISSASGFLGIYGYTAYSGSKFAVRGFSEALRNELRPKGIYVAIVYPPDTDTEQLAYEVRFKPRVTKDLAGNAGLLSPEAVAKCIVNGISRRQNIILPGIENKFIYFLQNLFGDLTYTILDKLACNSWKNSKSNQK